MAKSVRAIERNVVTEVVAKSLCCGCGVCAAVCPDGVLEMKLNARGELVPALVGDCSHCQLCLKVCPALEVGQPFSPDWIADRGSRIPESSDSPAPAQSEIRNPKSEIALMKQDPHLGSFIGCWVGYSSRHRMNSASGGMATWTLEQLFHNGSIGAAICVGRSSKADRLFEPVIVSSAAELSSCSSSRYYPVEFSSVLQHVLRNEGRYAIVALPCAVTGIRKAQRVVPVLRERIRYVFALACGHGVSKQFTDFLLAAAGIPATKVKTADFRYSARSRKATNFAFRAQNAAGDWSRPLYFDGLYGALWNGRFFVPRACEFCDDLFAPLADATFMDAWLPEYAGDVQGTSIVVARHPDISRMMQRSQERGAFLQSIAAQQVRMSQSGALVYKTTYLPLRVARAERSGLKIPRSFPRAAIRGGPREPLARIKHSLRDHICRVAFDNEGRPRRFWISVLSAYLEAQRTCRAVRRRLAPR